MRLRKQSALVGAAVLLVLACTIGLWTGADRRESAADARLNQGEPRTPVKRQGASANDFEPPTGPDHDLTEPVHPYSVAARRHRTVTRLGCGLTLLVGTNRDGAPVEGAVAVATSGNGDSFRSDPTDSAGRALLDVPCGSHSIEVEKPGFTPARFRTTLTPTDVFLFRTIALKRSGNRSGTILDEAGNPVSQAVVSVAATDEEEWPRRVTTGEDGSFQVDLSESGGRLHVSKSGFEPYSAMVGLGAPWQEIIVLRRSEVAVRYSGFVINREGQPIEGASVVARPVSGSPRATTSALTDRAGRFDIKMAVDGPVRLMVTAGGCLDLRRVVDPSKPPSRFPLDCYPTFDVTVLDLAGNAVQSPTIEGVSPTTGERLVKCSDRGRCYSVEYPVQIEASALETGRGFTAPLLVPSYVPEIVLRLERSAAITATLHDPEGSPVRSFAVRIKNKPFMGFSHVDSEAGVFRLECLPEGEYDLVFAATGYEPLCRRVRLSKRQTLRLDLTLRLLPAGRRAPAPSG